MIKNFTIPEGEEPFYYSSTVEFGEVVHHDGDPEHAVYHSEIAEIQRRAKLWHNWVENNVPEAYEDWGNLKEDVMAEHWEVNRAFMDGERSE